VGEKSKGIQTQCFLFFSFLFPLKGFIPNLHNLHKIIFWGIIDGWVVGGGAN
jgi:hypothetical protein